MSDEPEITVLGGGMNSLSAAFQLTSFSDCKERYPVTVYQPGWRLGGKHAISRVDRGNPAEFNRIEEHGLHVWFGFYEKELSS